MRGVLPLALALTMVLGALPGQAQMRGFRGGGPARPGVFAGRAPFGGGVRISGGTVFGHNPRVSIFIGPRFHRRVFFGPFFPHTGFFRHRVFFPPFFSSGIGYAYPPVYPYPYSYDSGYDSGYDRDRALQGQLADLQAEVQSLRRQQDELLAEKAREQRAAEESRATAPPSATHIPQVPQPLTIFVFRDGTRREAQSYAIVGQTVWILSEQRSRKIPLSDLDLDATAKINEQRGVEFRLPAQESRPRR